jgi:dTMP kinase
VRNGTCDSALPWVGMNSPAVHTVALVGIDGSGKTTQAHRLADELTVAGFPAAYRRNAGGRHWVGKVAAFFGREDAEALIGRRAMLAVESALRWLAILRTTLRRAFSRDIAVMDRYAFCQYASLRARGARPAAERRARLAYRLFPAPDVTFLLDVDPAVAQDRIDRRGYDHETMDYLRAARNAYHSLPEFADFVVIDANGTPDEVAALIQAELRARLEPQQAVPGQAPAPVIPTPVIPAPVAGAPGPLVVPAAVVDAPVPVVEVPSPAVDVSTLVGAAPQPVATVPGQRRRLVARALMISAAPLLAAFAVLSVQLAESL